MKRFGVAILSLGLLAACATGTPGSLGSAPRGTSPGTRPAPSVQPSGSATAKPSPGGRKLTFEVWFVRAGKLFLTTRREAFNVAVGKLSLDALAKGPSVPEVAAGVQTELPSDVALAITALATGNATVEVRPPLPLLQEGTPAARLAKAQVVYTLTQYTTIRKVTFRSGGTDTSPYSRASFDDLLPPILVEAPVIGQKIPNPVTVSGTANVFEATVSLRILDQKGKTVANTFTTATCGTGCRGDYSASVSYRVDRAQPGTVEVFESSAQDGSPIHVVDIAVTLTP